MGGGKASQRVDHATLSLRQGEGNHTLPRFPSQTQNFLFLLCRENFKVYSLYITMAEMVELGGGETVQDQQGTIVNKSFKPLPHPPTFKYSLNASGQ